jgi:hypothetical protein
MQSEMLDNLITWPTGSLYLAIVITLMGPILHVGILCAMESLLVKQEARNPTSQSQTSL